MIILECIRTSYSVHQVNRWGWLWYCKLAVPLGCAEKESFGLILDWVNEEHQIIASNFLMLVNLSPKGYLKIIKHALPTPVPCRHPYSFYVSVFAMVLAVRSHLIGRAAQPITRYNRQMTSIALQS